MSLQASLKSKHRSQPQAARWNIYLLLIAALALGLPSAVAADADVLLVLDNSGSMRKNDPEFLLQRAVSKFVSELGTDTRVGMLIFDQGVDYPVPLGTLDVQSREAIRAALEQIDYRGQLTNSPAAIERAVYELKADTDAGDNKIIIFMTDGIVDTGDAEIDKDKTKWMREELSADAADSGIRMFAIAFTENADFFLIQSLAKRTNGEYFRALTPQDLVAVFDSVHQKLEAAAPVVTTPVVVVPPPAVVAPPAASGCLATLVDEERLMMEEAAPDAGITAEQLCQEMMAVEPGVPYVVPPPGVEEIPPPAMSEQYAETAASDEDLGLMLIIGLAALLLLILVVLVVVLLRRRGGGAAAVAAPPIPDAFLKDINGITGDPATQIGHKPMVIGRVMGTDPTHMDYFVVDKGTIGRRHAIIQYRDFSFWLHDQGSVNGTYLNGEQITGERQLKHGDRIKFHKYEFEFSVPEMAEGGHTVFADPSEATMIGDATIIGSTAAFAASDLEAAAPTPPASSPTPASTIDRVGDMFDGESDTQVLPQSPYAELPEGDETAEGDIPVVEAAAMTPVVVPALDDEVLPTDEEFDAEASAFFDNDDLGQTNAPMMGMDDFDEGPAATPDPEPAEPVEDFSESETMVPGDVYEDHGTVSLDVSPSMNETSEISLDEFMRTDTFDAPIPGFDRDDVDDDATLMPDHIPDGEIGEATGAPSIDDVFDITGEGTVPPVRDDEDDGDDSEAPTQFRR